MLKFLSKTIEKAENLRTNFSFWAMSFLCLIILRLLIEGGLGGFKNRSGSFLFYEFSHTFLFFLTSYLLFLAFFMKFLKITLARASNILLLGFLLILSPPIIDHLLSGGRGYWSFYDFGGLRDLGTYFLNFFDNTPTMGITYGVRLEVALAVIFIFFYSLLKAFDRKNFPALLEFLPFNFIKNLKLKIETSKILTIIHHFIFSLTSAILAYSIFFVLGTFPSWIAIAVQGFSHGFFSVGEVDVARQFLTPAEILSREIPELASSLNIKMSLIYAVLVTGIIILGSFFSYREKMLAFLRNARFPQLFYHSGLLLVGVGLGIMFSGETVAINFINSVALLVMLIAVSCAWLASVVVNDFQDIAIDRETNPQRPLIQKSFSPEEYRLLGIVFFSVSLLFSAVVSFKAVFLLFGYQALAWTYSSWPLRFKRFIFISTFLSALASLLILFVGYALVSPTQDLRGLPFSLIALLVFGLTLALPIKDFKDLDGDRQDGVRTLPVVFGVEWSKIIIGSGIFISYLLSVAVLHEFRLFWWAILCGGASFWIIHQMKDPALRKGRIHYRNIFWWIMAVLLVYLIALLKIVFSS